MGYSSSNTEFSACVDHMFKLSQCPALQSAWNAIAELEFAKISVALEDQIALDVRLKRQALVVDIKTLWPLSFEISAKQS